MTATDPTASNPTVTISTEQKLLIRQAAERLQREFAGTFDTETIERYISDSQTRVESRAEFANWLPILIEKLTRDRLRALERLEIGALDRPGVLFLCFHNAGRSQMAAGFLRHSAGDQVDVFSAGSDPGHEQNATAIEAMAEVGIDVSAEYPKPWTDEIARAADVIITMGCGDACPVYPAKRYEDWELEDPSGQPIETVRTIREDIRQRVEELVASFELGSV